MFSFFGLISPFKSFITLFWIDISGSSLEHFFSPSYLILFKIILRYNKALYGCCTNDMTSKRMHQWISRVIQLYFKVIQGSFKKASQLLHRFWCMKENLILLKYFLNGFQNLFQNTTKVLQSRLKVICWSYCIENKIIYSQLLSTTYSSYLPLSDNPIVPIYPVYVYTVR